MEKSKIEKIFSIACKKGDFCEVYYEECDTLGIALNSSKIDRIVTSKTNGVGIRILSGVNSVFGHTNDLSLDNLVELTNNLSSAIEGGNFELKELKKKDLKSINNIEVMPNNIKIEDKIKYMEKADEVARSYDSRISQVVVNYKESIKNITIFNSDGNEIDDTRVNIRFSLTCVAKDGDNIQTSFNGEIGGHAGFEIFDKFSVEDKAKEVAKSAITMLSAEFAPSKEMTVILENGFGGVIFHEACGHGLESTSVSKGLSVFTGKVGEKVASELVTAIDDGTIPNGWGSLNIDDEGNETKKNILIEKGILKGYMIDKLGARRMNTISSGNGRRESYKYAPTSRMTNTYIANGTSSLEEMLEGIEYGLYAAKMGGGSVDTTTGDFNFAVTEGYIIKNGKITTPVKGCTLIGNGPKSLLEIDMVGDNLKFDRGMCGSASGSIPADVGQPRIRIKNITVGGR